MNTEPRAVEQIADLFNIPPHIIADTPRHRWTWRLRRWHRRMLRRQMK
jgi:hypothetical protein